jgi:hypothetical protein
MRCYNRHFGYFFAGDGHMVDPVRAFAGAQTVMASPVAKNFFPRTV